MIARESSGHADVDAAVVAGEKRASITQFRGKPKKFTAKLFAKLSAGTCALGCSDAKCSEFYRRHIKDGAYSARCDNLYDTEGSLQLYPYRTPPRHDGYSKYGHKSTHHRARADRTASARSGMRAGIRFRSECGRSQAVVVLPKGDWCERSKKFRRIAGHSGSRLCHRRAWHPVAVAIFVQARCRTSAMGTSK